MIIKEKRIIKILYILVDNLFIYEQKRKSECKRLWREGVGDTNIKVSARMNFIGLQGEKHFRC